MTTNKKAHPQTYQYDAVCNIKSNALERSGTKCRGAIFVRKHDVQRFHFDPFPKQLVVTPSW